MNKEKENPINTISNELPSFTKEIIEEGKTLKCSECGERFPFDSHEHICKTYTNPRLEKETLADKMKKWVQPIDKETKDVKEFIDIIREEIINLNLEKEASIQDYLVEAEEIIKLRAGPILTK